MRRPWGRGKALRPFPVWQQAAVFSVLALVFGGRLIRSATERGDTATEQLCYRGLFALILVVDSIWIGRDVWKKRRSSQDEDGPR